jgi:hypothetical protein
MCVAEGVIYKYSASPTFIDGSFNISCLRLHVPSRKSKKGEAGAHVDFSTSIS